MKINEKLIKPLTETKYLNVDNTDRYRPIIRLFYLEYEKLRYWMYPEEVFEELHKEEYFKDYTEEQCRQDLEVLKNWGNLSAIQDTKRVNSIEEFKNKKYRYQLTDYSVEIERMVMRLENLSIEGASLEPTLLEKIRMSLSEIPGILDEDDEHLHGWWESLNSDFKRLNQNYQDYMRDLNSMKAEEMMKTKAFLMFKDHLIEYLRSFVKSLQLNATNIEQLLSKLSKEQIQMILERLTEYEFSIPRIDVEVTKEQLWDKIHGRWRSIENWFLGTAGAESEAGKVFDTTNEIIRRITRYATRISEQNHSGANTREEYAKIARLFWDCKTIEEAHRLSAVVFGIEKPLHLKGDIKRDTESINSGVYEEPPAMFTVVPRVRTYREKSERKGIIDRTKEKEQMRRENLKKLKRQQELLDSYVKGNRLEFATLPEIEPYVRDTFLMWLSKALERKEQKAKTEDGRTYYIEKPQHDQRCLLKCSDGTFEMPAYTIVFHEE